jgi:RNA polymerase-binding transcription factor DksA
MTNRDGPQQPRELSAADKSHLGAALREQRQFRVEQLAELAEEERRGGTPSSSLEVTAALKRAAAHALTEIEAALTRLRDGSYGKCGSCAQHISPDRLEVLPAAALCMACQRRADYSSPSEPILAGGSARRTE